jgi:hypothetical protein
LKDFKGFKMKDLQKESVVMRQVFDAVQAKYASLADAPKLEKRDKDDLRVDMITKILNQVKEKGDLDSGKVSVNKAFGQAAFHEYGASSKQGGHKEVMHATMLAELEAERFQKVFGLVQSGQKIQDAVDQVYNPFIRADVPENSPA